MGPQSDLARQQRLAQKSERKQSGYLHKLRSLFSGNPKVPKFQIQLKSHREVILQPSGAS